MARLGVLGGTFDPVHLGHLAVGRAAAAALALDHVRLMPSRVPPHRSVGPRASSYHRFAMAALAALGEPGWTVSDMELRRDGPSYSADTLTALAAEGWAATQIFFLIGADAFADIATWSRYPAVLDLAHFVVVTRPGTTHDDVRARVPALAPRMTTADEIGARATPGIVLLAADTPNVSSTDIRARAARGASLTGLVTEPVEQYIRRHGLYV
jgi:nicotinate-nucleotide adenylyltransferase